MQSLGIEAEPVRLDPFNEIYLNQLTHILSSDEVSNR
jgi:hypothetical protein